MNTSKFPNRISIADSTSEIRQQATPAANFNLNNINKTAYIRFLESGLAPIFHSIFPIVSSNGNQKLKLKKIKIDDPVVSFEESRKILGSYEFGINLTLQLVSSQEGERINYAIYKSVKLGLEEWMNQKFEIKKTILVSEKKNIEYVYNVPQDQKKNKLQIVFKIEKMTSDTVVFSFEITKEETVFFGHYPMISDKGTFLINGVEKVVVYQMVRIPGVFYSIAESTPEYETYSSEIILKRGTWIDFVTKMHKIKNDDKTYQYFPILESSLTKTKSNSTIISNIFSAFGLSKNQILDLLNYADEIVNSYNSASHIDDQDEAMRYVYSKISENANIPADLKKIAVIDRLFGDERFFLSKFGRYKINQKLSIINQLYDRVLAEDLIDSKTKKVIFTKGTWINDDNAAAIKTFFESANQNNFITIVVSGKKQKIQKVKVFTDNFLQKEIVNILGVDTANQSESLSMADIIVTVSGTLNLSHDIGAIDDIDSLGNRAIRLVDELVEESFKAGLTRVGEEVKKKLNDPFISKFNHKIIATINFGPLSNSVRDFFNLSQLSQFLDQLNPLTELANKRRVTVLGKGGLKRETSSTKVRDVHSSFFGKICPIETPEGPNIGLISNLSFYASVNKWNLLETFYWKVVNKKVTNERVSLSTLDEKNSLIAPATTMLNSKNEIANPTVHIYHHDNIIEVLAEKIQYIGYASEQMFSVATAMIPFLENNDANRALMGANMMKQALPLIQAESPIVGTGHEKQVATDSGFSLVTPNAGVVTYADSTIVKIKENGNKKEVEYYPYNFIPTNQRTALSHQILVNAGDEVEAGQVLADGISIENGELALGKNLLVGFMTWKGYNYEDALIVSEKLVRENTFTSLHIEEHEIKRLRTKLGDEEFTNEIINTSEYNRRLLDDDGIVVVGSEVEPGDILVGKVTPKDKGQSSPEDLLLRQLFKGRERNIENSSLFVPNGVYGVVQKIQRFTGKDLKETNTEVIEVIKIYIARKIFIKEGDKMASRHGNKGVISRVLNENSMPYMADGTPIDIMINPLGVPSRMNVGQLLEMHFGFAAKKLGHKVTAPLFHQRHKDKLQEMMLAAKANPNGSEILYDGETGEAYNRPVAVGYIYYMKLSHIVESKIHAREIGPYSLITQQPLKGKAQNGGQRFGEMEVWALESYGAAYNLRELLTIKSDDIKGRNMIYWALINKMPRTINFHHFAESFNVLFSELRALCINLEIIPKSEVDLQDVLKQQ